jgi:hypothetical protein
MKCFRLVLWLGVLLPLCPNPAGARDSLGHLLITQIAEDQLTPESRAAIAESTARTPSSVKVSGKLERAKLRSVLMDWS